MFIYICMFIYFVKDPQSFFTILVVCITKRLRTADFYNEIDYFSNTFINLLTVNTQSQHYNNGSLITPEDLADCVEYNPNFWQL